MLICIVLIIINTTILLKVFKNDKAHLFVKILLAVSYFGWNALPLTLSFIPIMREFLIANYDSYIECNIINQVYFVFVYRLFLYLLDNKETPAFAKKPDFQCNHILIKRIGLICLVILMFNIFLQLSQGSFYLDRNDIDSDLGRDGGLLRYFSSFGLYGTITILLFYRHLFSKSFLFLLNGLITFYYLSVAFGGGRITMFAIVILLLYYAIEQRKKTILIGTIGLGVFAFALLPAISSVRGLNEKSFAAKSIVSNASFDYVVIMHELLNKTNSVESSSFLIKHDGVGGGGMNVYTSTLYSLIPRSLYPDKPQPGSKDGTSYGLPSRLAASYIQGGDYNGISNVGISPSIEALWAGGWIMLIIQIFISAFSIFVINGIVSYHKIFYMYFVFTFIGFPICMLDISIVTLLRDLPRFIVIFVFIKLILQQNFHVRNKQLY